MKLLVSYEVHTFEELDEEHFFKNENIIVNVPDDLLQSEFKSFVIKTYYDDIYKIEKECSGSLLLGYKDIEIINVVYISELKKEF